MKKNIGFLFDLDGVLIDSEREYTRIWEEIERTFPTGIPNFARAIKGQTLTKILTDNYPDEGIRNDVSVMLHKLEGEMHYAYCPGAEEFLHSLNRQGARIAVVTSSDEVKMSHLYADLPDFKSKVRLIVDASKVTRSKPDPQGYLLAAELLGTEITNCAVFEDSIQGVKAGRASGAYVVGITGTKSREELLPYSDIVIDNLAEIDIKSLSELLENKGQDPS